MSGNILRLIRIANNMNIKQTSEKIGLSTSHISDLERGRKKVSLSVLEKYCFGFNIPPSKIILFDSLQENLSYQQLLKMILEYYLFENNMEISKGESEISKSK